MPNWCNNRVELSGSSDDLKVLRSLIGTDDQAISFQRIKPMPEDLGKVEAGSAEDGYEVLYGDADKVLAYKWVQDAGITNRDELIAYFKRSRPGDLEAAKLYKANLDRYGHRHWYSWCVENWGTKWDVGPEDVQVIHDEDGYLRLEFYTAWSPPQGVYDALCELIDANGLDVQITWFYDEPGMQYAGYLSAA